MDLSHQSKNKILLKICWCIIILYFFNIISCNKEIKILEYYEIPAIDNKIPIGKNGIKFIDSMLKIYPTSEYLFAMKIIKLISTGEFDSANKLYHDIAGEKKIYGTFMETALGYYYMFGKTDLPGLNERLEKVFLEAIDHDTHKVNLHARVYLSNIYFDLKEYGKAEKYLYEALEINNQSSYVFHNLAFFYYSTKQYKRALYFTEKIDPKYKVEEVTKLKISIDSLMQKDTFKK